MSPVSVQSMTTTKTADVDGTLAQIYTLAAAGCDIVRCTCNEEAAAEGLAQIVPRSPVPLIADIHFQYHLALAAMEAGVAGLRLNPGNIRKPEHIKAVAAEAKDRGLPIRIGVNGGTLDPDIAKQYGGRHARSAGRVGGARARLLRRGRVRGRQDLGEVVERAGMIDAYRLLSETRRLPAAPGRHRGRARCPRAWSSRPPASRRCSPRASATPSGSRSRPTPSRRRRRAAQLLESMGLRERKGLDLIACPTCGRAEVDVIKVARRRDGRARRSATSRCRSR